MASVRSFPLRGAALAAVLAGGLLSACAMSKSSLIEATSGELGCRSNAGAYYLGRTYFNVQINNDAGSDQYYLAGVTPVRRIDREHGFCLDYRGSITADEAFVVKKTHDGLLTQITSSADDQSAKIAKTIAQAFFVAVSGNANFESDAGIIKSAVQSRVSSTKVVDQTYDPDNDADAALLNNSIKDFGFCLVMEDQVFDHHHTSIDDYCDAPLRRKRVERVLAATSHGEGPLPSVHDERHGIFYRPRQTRSVYLYIKQDLRRPKGWKLRASQAVPIENTSPIMFVGIDRTFFAKRETTVHFDDGALTDIAITKKSELAGFVSVPLYIAQSIVALPAQIVQIKIVNINNDEKLLRARESLITAEEKLLIAQKAAQTNPTTGGGGTTKTAGIDPGDSGLFKASQPGGSPEQQCREATADLQRDKITVQDCIDQIPSCRTKHGSNLGQVGDCAMSQSKIIAKAQTRGY